MPTLNTRSEISHLRAAMYYPLYNKLKVESMFEVYLLLKLQLTTTTSYISFLLSSSQHETSILFV